MTTFGIALLLVGVVLAATEAHVPTGGALGATGTVAAVVGAVLAVDGSGGGAVLVAAVALLVAVVLGGVLAVALRTATRAAGRRPASGREALVGRHGRACTAIGTDGGRVLVEGALWRARPTFDEETADEGDEVVVERIEGLTLSVRRAEPWERSA